MSHSVVRISEGYTYEYLIHGIITAIIATVFALVIHPVFFSVVLVGIIMSSSKTGIEINKELKKTRKYVSWIFLKTGHWYDLTKVVKIQLKYNTQHTVITRPIYLNKGDTTAKTFDLVLINDVEDEIILNEFTKPSLAFKTLNSLRGISNYEIDNQVKEMLNKQNTQRKR